MHRIIVVPPPTPGDAGHRSTRLRPAPGESLAFGRAAHVEAGPERLDTPVPSGFPRFALPAVGGLLPLGARAPRHACLRTDGEHVRVGGGPDTTGPGPRLGGEKRESPVSPALRFGPVREEGPTVPAAAPRRRTVR
ncbi:hypothetical protein [Streptomyces sp. NEAU-W12]|uniref:hypothetical protein n=1 Tax=Streptomyces sp. NEAU-W12 TaxID=2994668 RepID=UPI00224B48BB|nr:hypothetical protein [Streptomyces sp. NEAU-W12]MCX2927211.1 hypothetical protein [Streptomyces sp. NEAU-W12]